MVAAFVIDLIEIKNCCIHIQGLSTCHLGFVCLEWYQQSSRQASASCSIVAWRSGGKGFNDTPQSNRNTFQDASGGPCTLRSAQCFDPVSQSEAQVCQVPPCPLPVYLGLGCVGTGPF